MKEKVQLDLDIFKNAIDSIRWDITPFSQDELQDIRKKYLYLDTNYSQSTLADHIRTRIKEILCSTSGGSARSVFWELNRTFLFQFYIDGTENYLLSNILGQLFHVFGNEDFISDINEEKLKEALFCFKDKLRLYNLKVSLDRVDQNDNRLLAVSNCVKKLKNKFSLNYKIEHGNVWIETEEFVKIGDQLSKFMNILGGQLFQENMVNVLIKNKKYSSLMQRFLFPIPSSQMGDKIDPTVPWGYLFNLSLRHPHQGNPLIINKGPIWTDLIEYSTALLSALDIEPYSIWDTEFKSGESTFKMLSEMSLLESNFRIPQIRASDVMKIFKGLFSWVVSFENSSFPLSYSNLNYFINNLSKHLFSDRTHVLNTDDLKAMMSRLNESQLSEVLSVYCHNSPSPNSSFVSPLDYHEANATMKPFIKLSEEEILIPLPSHSCLAIFEATMSYYRGKISDFDSKIGTQMELFVKGLLEKMKIPFLSGEYKNSDGEEGEIDIAVEFEDLIGLIEIKKKSITRKSQNGDGDSLLFDVHKSLLDSQLQALNHEYTLHKDGKIQFSNGTTLELKERRVEKITLTLFDYGAIQDRTIIRQLLIFYMQCRFNVSSSEKRYKDLNDKCDKFSQKYTKLSSLFEKPENIPFFGSCFFSVPQFLILLDDVKDAAGLKKSLFNTKFTTSKSLDWYFEHEQMSKIKSR